ncbi:MauE/DoxX family redox-associated membrane protein [Flavobacterium terrisoli]|uniref:MauE/DoxX family redox-associated membrane protein n=1 Tax=Flavobacterium terrisoli TaxID=3242195 RepID=UPI002543B47F|nr:MauE/DoxX family redox-associated membrane protein [Flavobacterium buctense]
MKLSSAFKKNLIYTVALLHILLFSYAAFSKLSDYETFTIQLGQSPLLSAFAGWVSWFIPLLEILLAILLMFNRTRFFALVSSFGLMMMFSAYIYIILHYSEFVPCSCGGILEKMTWNEHLVFNLCFCFLSAFAIIVSLAQLPQQNKVWKTRYKIILLLSTSVFAIGIVLLLFLKSEQIIHQENNFVRRYPPHLYNKSGQLNLKYDGYYFAGRVNDTIYLGNYTAPLSIVAINNNLKIIGNYKIQLDNYELPYRAALIRISPPYFFLTDGTVPCIFRGRISNWRANEIPGIKTHFSVFETIDSTTAAIRSRNPKNNESILGQLKFSADTTIAFWNHTLLQKQIDGVFDSDGMLRYNPENQKLVYSYFYRNQFIVADKNLQLSYRGNTIDTTKTAKIKIATLSNGDRKLAGSPLMVNKLISTSENNLFVYSNLKGRYESNKLWRQTSVIDVYDLKTKNYNYSFYVYHINGKKPQEMFATKNKVYFIFDNTIVAYQIDRSVRR